MRAEIQKQLVAARRASENVDDAVRCARAAGDRALLTALEAAATLASDRVRSLQAALAREQR